MNTNILGWQCNILNYMHLLIKIIKNGGYPGTTFVCIYIVFKKKGKSYCKAMWSCSSVNQFDLPETLEKLEFCLSDLKL